MTGSNITLSQQTTLAINVIIEDDTGILACSILVATKLFTCFWQLGQWITMVKIELTLLVTDLQAALDFTAKVFIIGFNSLAYGLGVRL